MKKTVLAVACCTLWLASPALAATQTPCPAYQWGGTVTSIVRVSAKIAPKRAITRESRGSDSVDAKEGDVLCGGDIVLNPTDSGLRAVVSLTGKGDQPVAPGQELAIPYPTLTATLEEFGQRFERMFGSNSLYVPSGTRGPGEAPEVNVVPQWGPVLLLWPAQGGAATTWTVEMKIGDVVRTATTRQDYALIDVAHDCPLGCSLSVASRNGPNALSVDLAPRAASEAPRPQWLGTLDHLENRALFGAWLTDALSDGAWTNQGLSLMWSAACTFPAVRLHLKPYFGRPVDAGEACHSTVLSFK